MGKNLMQAMVLVKPGKPLILQERPRPRPGSGEVLLKVAACGVCRTDLHVYDGELSSPVLPLVLGHEIVGTIVEVGHAVDPGWVGRRMGVPWLGKTCGHCDFCLTGQENLCAQPRFTGYQFDGGYTEYAVADLHYCFPIPAGYSAVAAAPLLCAGLIGFRSLRLTKEAKNIGLYGFGAAAHILAQIAVFQGRKVYAFTRPGDRQGQEFARKLGASWAGGSEQQPDRLLDAAIIFAPAGHLVPQALRAVRKGGRVVCAGIHMSDIPSFPYHLLWGERSLCSVANLTRADGLAFFELLQQVPVATTVEVFPLWQANEALHKLRTGQLTGAAVLQVGGVNK